MKPTTKGVWAGIPGTNNYTYEIHKRPFFPPHMNFTCVIVCTWNPARNALCGRFHAGSRSKINFVRRSWYKFEHCKSNNRNPGQNFYWGAHFSYEIRMCRVKTSFPMKLPLHRGLISSTVAVGIGHVPLLQTNEQLTGNFAYWLATDTDAPRPPWY